MPTLFLPLSERSHPITRIASTVYARCKIYFRGNSKGGSLLAALLCTICILFSGSVFAEDANSDVKPGMLFYIEHGGKVVCASKKGMYDMIQAIYERDENASIKLLEGECSPELPTDVKMKVDRVESVKGTSAKIVTFHNSTEPSNKWPFYTLIDHISASTPPTPYASYLSTPTVGAAASGKTVFPNLKAGDSFRFNPKFTISCVNSRKIAELYKYAAKHDLINFNHMLIGEHLGGCRPRLYPRTTFQVIAIEKVEGIDEAVVHFRNIDYQNDKVGAYTLMEFIAP